MASKDLNGNVWDDSCFRAVYERYRDEFDSIEDVYMRADYLANLYFKGGIERFNRWFLCDDEEYIRLHKALVNTGI